MQVHRTIKPPITIYYTDDIMGEVVDYIRISSNRVREAVLQEHHQNAQCLLLLWQIMGNFARLRSTFTQCGHGPLWWWHRCFFYETWQKFTHITYRKKNSRLGKSWFVRVTDQRNCCFLNTESLSHSMVKLS